MHSSRYPPTLDVYQHIIAFWSADSSVQVLISNGQPVLLMENQYKQRVPSCGLFPADYPSRQALLETANSIVRALMGAAG